MKKADSFPLLRTAKEGDCAEKAKKGAFFTCEGKMFGRHHPRPQQSRAITVLCPKIIYDVCHI